MGQKKLQRFADIKTFSNVLEYPEGMKGKWNSFFKNESDIYIVFLLRFFLMRFIHDVVFFSLFVIVKISLQN